MVRHPRGSYVFTIIPVVVAVSGSRHTGKQINSSDAVVHMHKKVRTSQPVLSRMQLKPFMRLAQHLHGASRLVHAMPAWSVKTRRAPSRHCRDARVYDHTTTAMHDDMSMSTLPPPLLVRVARRLIVHSIFPRLHSSVRYIHVCMCGEKTDHIHLIGTYNI